MPDLSWHDSRTIGTIFLVAAIILTILQIAAIFESSEEHREIGRDFRTGFGKPIDQRISIGETSPFAIHNEGNLKEHQGATQSEFVPET